MLLGDTQEEKYIRSISLRIQKRQKKIIIPIVGIKVKVMVVGVTEIRGNREVSSIVVSEATINLRMAIIVLQMQISYPLRGSLSFTCTTVNSKRMLSRLKRSRAL